MGFNSTIMDKYTECIDCADGILKATIAGRCKNYHYSIYRKKLLAEKQKEKSKVRSLIQKPGNKKLLVEKGKKVDNDLELWYLARRYQMVGYCTECSKPTQPKHDRYYRWSIAHICAKSTVPSVATNYHNWIELCQQCHQEYDNNFEKAKNMKCFHEAKRKFQLFKDLIPPEEARKINPHLL